jgi:hypothetical protein
MTSAKHIFLAELGAEGAVNNLRKALKADDLPKKFRNRIRVLLKEVEGFASKIKPLATEARKKNSGNYSTDDIGIVGFLSWATAGLEKSKKELEILSRKDDSKDYLLKEAGWLLLKAELLLAEVKYYLDRVHPLDWMESLYEDTRESFKPLLDFGLGGGVIAPRPAIVASLWVEKKKSYRNR